ncbi:MULTISPECIES: MFS transporter [unclassified Mesorhizobium]|uniref:MFS transporter n=1 Tax=unclassified Mesorhizobium TaxID=325217 RepID=UPI000FCB1674|nr:MULTISPECIES: MFS transporter [unclassified Mesorhizobium]MDG4904860.1 MFS transporter [Mesorhizobium sp. WSM4898]RUV97682.1 MFS transporter [Mesorhizobium sp. M1A.F.Ca.IN.020.04.1.1]RUW15984.1 MFS transporter [Mesorhizobium sp. M1A.F.Ca.IN.020.03.1.1]RWG17698.1 MAG: MFS transporter [Mesorhizobium sp.]RWG28303.1 MAG: MFS transporter [Mesorhizobium sp.]
MAEVAVQRATGRGIWGWMFFDWAAQPFFTVVTTFIFGPYFVSRMASDATTGQAAWGYGIAAAGLVIAVLSPVLGSIADQTGPRKPWIASFAAVKIISLTLLWFAAPGSSLFLIVLLFSLASVAAEFSTVFNDSMMPRLVPKEDIGKISNIAWGLGYLGGMVALIFVVLFLAGNLETGKTIIGLDPLFGLDPKLGEDARFTGPMSAGWYFLFILPMFIFTPDAIKGLSMGPAVREGLSELKSTLFEVRKRVGIFRFLVARMIYQDGVNALLALGGTFAAGMFNWSITEIGMFGIILNVVAIFGCWIAARLDTALGSKAVVMIALMLLLLATIGVVSTGPGFTLLGLIQLPTTDSGGLFGTAAEKAYILYGLLIGLAFGPVQASSRSYMARSVTAAESGRYFGIYALAGRATSFLAPFLVSTITLASGSARLGMAVIALFLGLGMAILVRTPYPADKPVE